MKGLKKIMGLLIKWSFKTTLFIVIGVLLIANGFILLSGRTYIYKGVWLTYLSGRSGPTIYDLDKFPYRKIEKSNSTIDWIHSKRYATKTNIANFESYNEELQTTAFLIFEGDSIVFEKYWSPHNESVVSNAFSTAKTVVGLLIGVAIEEGKIKHLDEPVGNYIPEFKDEDRKGITIRHLLLMSSGLDWSESGKNPLSNNAESYYGDNLYELVTKQKRIDTPGKTFIYQSGNSQLLGFILQKVTGMSVAQYCSEKLWSKMNMEADAYWSLDKDNGNEKAFCCLYATARDFGRIGKLIRDKGEWNNQTLIPSWYFQEMIKPHPDMLTEQGYENNIYGLHIWLFQNYSSPIYYCRGIQGQYIISIPEKNRVIVRLGNKRRSDIESIEQTDTKKMVGHPADVLEYIKFSDQIIDEKSISLAQTPINKGENKKLMD